MADIEPPSRLIDYGCGQGLATLLLNDVTRGALLARVSEIVLIEPSAPALARAEAICTAIAPQATVKTVAKRFDDLDAGDLPSHAAGETLHIFSNTLDVPGYEPLNLLTKTLHHGRPTILAVSHDREFNGGNPTFERVKAAFEHPSLSSDLTIEDPRLERFQCTNRSRSDGVQWLYKFEVHDG